MNAITEVITRMTHLSESFPDISQIKVPRNYEEYLEWQCDISNKTVGNLQGYNCPECLNRGYISVIKDDVIVQRECRCMTIRSGFLKMKNAGFGKIAEKYTFDRYITREEWQKRAKEKAVKYVRENPDKWLFFGGQSGCGKTHLCTAVCKELIRNERDLKYILWRDTAKFLDSNRFDYDRYSAKMKEIQNIGVLYIDDFLKTTDKKTLASEVNYAYEIVNSRWISGKQTIISSEMFIDEITALDEATGGRIAEMSDDFQIQIKREKHRNFRLYGGKKI